MATPASKAQRNDEYTTLRLIKENLFLVRRNSDGETLLGRPFNLAGAPEMEHLDKLMGMGAGVAVSNVLNHENLVSVATTLTNFTWVGSGPVRTHMLLWDYCDAGTLDALFRTPPLAHSRTGFLPESLCWHVLRSVLAALAWLHDGYRVDYYNAVPRAKTTNNTAAPSRRPRRPRIHLPGPELRSEWIADPDWLPILHRAVRPENIYFQTPRGIETYGLCKLGNFGEAFVSGHVNWVSGGAVVSTCEGDSDLLEMKKRMAVENIYTVPKRERPYTRGSELYALGTIMYRMMTSYILPDAEECNLCDCRHLDPSTPACSHGCHFDIDLSKDPLGAYTDYTRGLRDVVEQLLAQNRADRDAAWELMDWVEDLFTAWRHETPDGLLYVDLMDDIRVRQENLRKKLEDGMFTTTLVGGDEGE